MLQLINESLSLILALGVGIYAYSHMNGFTRTLFFQLVTWMILLLASYILTTYQNKHGYSMDNQWLYNIQIAVELLFLVVAVRHVFKDQLIKHLSAGLYLLFLGTLFLQLTFSGLFTFSNYAFAVSGLTVTILYTLLLYRIFKTDPSAYKKSPEVVAAIGLLIYFACNIPYFSLFNYLNTHYQELSLKLFHIITDVLNNIRYACLAIAFWLSRKNSSVTKSTFNL